MKTLTQYAKESLLEESTKIDEMKWKGRRQSTNVIDLRSKGPAPKTQKYRIPYQPRNDYKVEDKPKT